MNMAITRLRHNCGSEQLMRDETAHHVERSDGRCGSNNLHSGKLKRKTWISA